LVLQFLYNFPFHRFIYIKILYCEKKSRFTYVYRRNNNPFVFKAVTFVYDHLSVFSV
jgi:hypothetical protein